MREFVERRNTEGTKDLYAPTRLAYINKFIELYTEGKKISQMSFVDCHDPKDIATDPKSTVRTYKQKFKIFMNDFFSSLDEQKYKYRLDFPKRGYHLLLQKNNPNRMEDSLITPVDISNFPIGEKAIDFHGTTKTETEEQLPFKEIPFVENNILELRYIPVIYLLLVSVVAGIALIFILTGGIIVKSPVLLAFLLVFAVVVIFVSRNLYRLPHWRFTHFFHRYFLRLSGKKIILATYSSTCPLCEGDMDLTAKFVKGMGYTARCRSNQHSHTFSFDHTSLMGKRL